MQLLVLLICLIGLQFLRVPKARLTYWFGGYVHLWVHFFSKQRWFNTPVGVIVLALIPVLIISSAEHIYSLIFALNILVVLFCLSVCSELRPTFVDPHIPTPHLPNLNTAALPKSLWQVNYYFVTPLFWYLILGVYGVVFYTCFLYASFCSLMPAWRPTATRIVEQAAWIPSRITGLAYGFAGNLKATLKIWGELLMTNSQSNHILLLRCADTAHLAKANVAPGVSYAKLLRDTEILLLGLFAVIAMIKMIF